MTEQDEKDLSDMLAEWRNKREIEARRKAAMEQISEWAFKRDQAWLDELIERGLDDLGLAHPKPQRGDEPGLDTFSS